MTTSIDSPRRAGPPGARPLRLASAAVLLLLVATGCGGDSPYRVPVPPGTTLQAGHEAVAEFAALGGPDFAALRETRIFYGHTSHGGQIVTGLQMIASREPDLQPPPIVEVADDLGELGDLSWAGITRGYLDDHPQAIDLVLWSWCGGVSGNTVAGIDAYLAEMAALEREYPGIVFVRMTGHLDGTGPAGNLRARNDQIRAWCREHGAPLYDFADIERHDPAGADHPDDTDACLWCAQWCATHDCPPCASCAHSHCLNCDRKGRAFWSLLARLRAAGLI